MAKVKRKLWQEEDMVSAMEAGESASKKFNVPRCTLDDRNKGRVKHGTNPGRQTVLTTEEESALVNYLLYMAERGFPLTPKMCMAFAWAISIRGGKEDRFSDTGPTMSYGGHPQFYATLCKCDNLERNRAEVVKEYFA